MKPIKPYKEQLKELQNRKPKQLVSILACEAHIVWLADIFKRMNRTTLTIDCPICIGTRAKICLYCSSRKIVEIIPIARIKALFDEET